MGDRNRPEVIGCQGLVPDFPIRRALGHAIRSPVAILTEYPTTIFKVGLRVEEIVTTARMAAIDLHQTA